MTSRGAVNKCFFHSSLGTAAVTAGATELVTCQPISDLITQESDVHRLSPTHIVSVHLSMLRYFRKKRLRAGLQAWSRLFCGTPAGGH